MLLVSSYNNCSSVVTVAPDMLAMESRLEHLIKEKNLEDIVVLHDWTNDPRHFYDEALLSKYSSLFHLHS